jgi:hypothetical protein
MSCQSSFQIETYQKAPSLVFQDRPNFEIILGFFMETLILDFT